MGAEKIKNSGEIITDDILNKNEKVKNKLNEIHNFLISHKIDTDGIDLDDLSNNDGSYESKEEKEVEDLLRNKKENIGKSLKGLEKLLETFEKREENKKLIKEIKSEINPDNQKNKLEKPVSTDSLKSKLEGNITTNKKNIVNNQKKSNNVTIGANDLLASENKKYQKIINDINFKNSTLNEKNFKDKSNLTKIQNYTGEVNGYSNNIKKERDSFEEIFKISTTEISNNSNKISNKINEQQKLGNNLDSTKNEYNELNNSYNSIKEIIGNLNERLKNNNISEYEIKGLKALKNNLVKKRNEYKIKLNNYNKNISKIKNKIDENQEYILKVLDENKLEIEKFKNKYNNTIKNIAGLENKIDTIKNNFSDIYNKSNPNLENKEVSVNKFEKEKLAEMISEVKKMEKLTPNETKEFLTLLSELSKDGEISTIAGYRTMKNLHLDNLMNTNIGLIAGKIVSNLVDRDMPKLILKFKETQNKYEARIKANIQEETAKKYLKEYPSLKNEYDKFLKIAKKHNTSQMILGDFNKETDNDPEIINKAFNALEKEYNNAKNDIFKNIKNSKIKNSIQKYLEGKDKSEIIKLQEIINKFYDFEKYLEGINIEKEYNEEYINIREKLENLNKNYNLSEMQNILNNNLNLIKNKYDGEGLKDAEEIHMREELKEIVDKLKFLNDKLNSEKYKYKINKNTLKKFEKIKEKFGINQNMDIEKFINSKKFGIDQFGIKIKTVRKKDLNEVTSIKYTLNTIITGLEKKDDVDYFEEIINNYESSEEKRNRVTEKRRQIIKNIDEKISKENNNETKNYLLSIKEFITSRHLIDKEKNEANFWNKYEKQTDGIIDLIEQFYSLGNTKKEILKKEKIKFYIEYINKGEYDEGDKINIVVKEVQDETLYLSSKTNEKTKEKIGKKITNKEKEINEFLKETEGEKNIGESIKIQICESLEIDLQTEEPLTYLKLLTEIKKSLIAGIDLKTILEFYKEILNRKKKYLETIDLKQEAEKAMKEKLISKDAEKLDDKKALELINKITDNNIEFPIEKNKELSIEAEQNKINALAILFKLEKDDDNFLSGDQFQKAKKIIQYAINEDAFGDIRVINSIKILLSEQKNLTTFLDNNVDNLKSQTKKQIEIKKEFGKQMYTDKDLLCSYENNGKKNHNLLTKINIDEFKTNFSNAINSGNDKTIMNFIENHPTGFASFISYYMSGEHDNAINMTQLMTLGIIFQEKKSNFIGINKLISEAAGETTFMSKLVDRFGSEGKRKMLYKLKEKLKDEKFLEELSKNKNELEKTIKVIQNNELYTEKEKKDFIYMLRKLNMKDPKSKEKIDEITQMSKKSLFLNKELIGIISEELGADIDKEKVKKLIDSLKNILNGNDNENKKIIFEKFNKKLKEVFKDDKKVKEIGLKIGKLIARNEEIKNSTLVGLGILLEEQGNSDKKTNDITLNAQKGKNDAKENSHILEEGNISKKGVEKVINSEEYKKIVEKNNKQTKNLNKILNNNFNSPEEKKKAIEDFEKERKKEKRKLDTEIAKTVLHSKFISKEDKEEYLIDYKKSLEKNIKNLTENEKEILDEIEEAEYINNIDNRQKISYNITNLESLNMNNKKINIKNSKGENETLELSNNEYASIGFIRNPKTDEITIRNPEALKNLVDMKEKLSYLHLDFAWDYREDFLQIMNNNSDFKGNGVEADSEKLIDKTEFNIYLKFLLKIAGEQNPSDLESENFMRIRKINEEGIFGTSKNIHTGLSNFGNKFIPAGYLNSNGKKNLLGKDKLRAFVKNGYKSPHKKI